MKWDILIRGGEVVDPSQQLRAVRDVAIQGGLVAEIGEDLPTAEASCLVDARGLLVTPGLIDLHVHVYHRHVPISVEPDSLCPAGGVTTMLDAGSAGSFNFDGFRHDIIERAETQILALVNLSCTGLITAKGRNDPEAIIGELMDRRYADPKGVVQTIRDNPGVAVGVKIRAGKHLIGEGQQGWDNFMEAVGAARESGTWLMVHIGESPMPIPEMLEHLQAGDCITHCFKGGSERILDPEGTLFPAVREAAERGVVFDVGHGAGSFEWDVVEAAIEQGFEPTTISTDIHVKNLHGPVYDMPTTMSKFLHLGVPLERVMEMATTRPAQVLGLEDQIGTLKVGTVADIAVLQVHEGDFVLPDSYGQTRIGHQLLNAVGTVRRGEMVPGGGGLRMRHLSP
jgi:dihydroorotase